MRHGRFRLYVDRTHVATMEAEAEEFGDAPLRDRQPNLVTWRYSITDLTDGDNEVRADEGFRTAAYAQAAALAQFDGKRLRPERDEFLTGTPPAPVAVDGPTGGGGGEASKG